MSPPQNFDLTIYFSLRNPALRMRDACPSNLIYPDLIILIFGSVYKLLLLFNM
jgi:hypothetical protein